MIRGGIDNGADGGLVLLRDGQPWVAIPTPTLNLGSGTKKRRAHDIQVIVQYLQPCTEDTDAFLVLEHAQAFPREGAVTSFLFGQGFGVWQAALVALKIPFEVVVPRKWQKEILAGISGSDTKEQARLFLQRRHPEIPVIMPRCRVPHPGVVDAACMALYAARIVPPKQRLIPPPPPVR